MRRRRRRLAFIVLVAMLSATTACFAADRVAPPSLEIRESPMDLDHDGFFDVLVVDAVVRHLRPNREYRTHPHITAPARGFTDCQGPHSMTRTQFEARRQRRDVADREAGSVRSNAAGTARMELYFDADAISPIRERGPWRLETELQCARFPLDPRSVWESTEVAAELDCSDWHAFGTRPAYGESVRWSLDPDSLTVRLLVRSWVHRPDSLRFRAFAGTHPYWADSNVCVPSVRGAMQTEVLLHPMGLVRPPWERLDPKQITIRVIGLDFGWPDGTTWWLGSPEEFLPLPCGNP